jgi:hypothetical protein
LYNSCDSPGINYFSHKSWFSSSRKASKPRSVCWGAHNTGVSLLLGTFNRDSWGTLVCVCVCIYENTCIHIYRYLSMLIPLILIHCQTIYFSFPPFFVIPFSAIGKLGSHYL